MAAKRKPYGVTQTGQTVHQAMGGGAPSPIQSSGSFQGVRKRKPGSFARGYAEGVKAKRKMSALEVMQEEIEWLKMENEMLRADIEGIEWQ